MLPEELFLELEFGDTGELRKENIGAFVCLAGAESVFFEVVAMISLEFLCFTLLPGIVGLGLAGLSAFLAFRSRTMPQVGFAFFVSGVALLAVCWIAWIFLMGAWPTYLPCLMVCVAMVALISQIGFFNVPRFSSRWWLAACFSLAWIGGILFAYFQTGVERTEVVEVTWQFGPERPDAYGNRVILLRNSGMWGVIGSEEIATYLARETPRTIPVEIIRTYDLGKFRAWRIGRIAGIRDSHLWLDGSIGE